MRRRYRAKPQRQGTYSGFGRSRGAVGWAWVVPPLPHNLDPRHSPSPAVEAPSPGTTLRAQTSSSSY